MRLADIRAYSADCGRSIILFRLFALSLFQLEQEKWKKKMKKDVRKSKEFTRNICIEK